MSAPAIADRADVHKSCKSLEVVVNVLNDYCEAATAIVAIQKKLAKALREAASTRCVSEIAANALTASATIFEAVAEVENKFSKLVDKECDGISAEVKKWFKRLAKEERAHDERVANANYRIKQAGQIYEKNVKKNPADAAEEHNRYISLLSSLGPGITQEERNHALAVSQRHAAILFSIGACMARVADAEWLCACEGVRRISPAVGSVGEWRALCEGAWNGPVPSDLPDEDAVPTQPRPSTPSNHRTSYGGIDADRTGISPAPATPAPEYSSRAITPTDAPKPSNYRDFHATPEGKAAPPDSALPDLDDSRDRSRSVNSITSLGSFPAPPTHFPLPPVTALKHGNSSTPEPRDTSVDPPETFSTPKSSMDLAHEELLRPSSQNKAQQQTDDTFLDLDMNSPASSPSTSRGNVLASGERAEQPREEGTTSQTTLQSSKMSESASSLQTTSPSSPGSQPTLSPTSPRRVSGPRPSVVYKKGDYVEDTEFGVRRSTDMGATSSMQSPSPRLERTDTGRSNGSVVAAMRDKYSRSTGPASPPPRDIPRLPLSVPSLATKYELPGDSGATTPRTPVDEQQRVPQGAFGRMTSSPEASRLSPGPGSTYNLNDGVGSPTNEDITRRKQRLQELEELELREQEYELRLKEREFEQKARQLEQDRLRLLNARGLLADGHESQTNLRLPAADPSNSSLATQARHPYASSSTQLPVSRPPQRYASQQSLTGQQPQSSSPIPRPSHAHPPYCGCEACALARDPSSHARDVARPPSPRTLAPLTLRTDKPDKPKGWIRRLSMPVMGNAFSSDSKKGISSTTYTASNTGYRNSLAYPEEDGRLDSKNRSTTNLGRR